jgi:hypothetical protein
MRIWLLVLCFAAGTGSAVAHDSLTLFLSKSVLQAGDTLVFECRSSLARPKFNTLHITIADSGGKNAYRYRYPVLDKYTTGSVVLPAKVAVGGYSLTATLQREGFYVVGYVLGKKPPKEVNCLIFTKNRDTMLQRLPVGEGGSFQLSNLIFEDKASFLFSPVEPGERNRMNVLLLSPIDSAFTEVATARVSFTIVKPAGAPSGIAGSGNAMVLPGSTLANVEVVAKKMTEKDLFERRYVTGMFNYSNFSFDAFSDPNITNYTSVLHYLMGKVPGLNIVFDRDAMSYVGEWRSAGVSYYVDEIETDAVGLTMVPPADVALIKVYRPPFRGPFNYSGSSAIAVYTHRDGRQEGSNWYLNRFVLHGYTPQDVMME